MTRAGEEYDRKKKTKKRWPGYSIEEPRYAHSGAKYVHPVSLTLLLSVRGPGGIGLIAERRSSCIDSMKATE